MLSKINRILNVLVLISISVIMFIMNLGVPLFNDDYVHSLNIITEQRILNLWDIVVSQFALYLMWTGRILVHGTLQIFLIQDKIVFDIINSIVFTVLVYIIVNLIQKICQFNYQLKFLLYIVVFTIILIYSPAFYQCTLWIAGSANYLWTTTALLFYILNIYKVEDKSNAKGLNILSFIVGFSQENVSIIAFIILLSEVIRQKLLKKDITKYEKVMIWQSIGSLLLFLAPGNFKRKAVAYFVTSNVLNEYMKNILKLISNGYLVYLFITVLIMIYIVLNIKNIKKMELKQYRICINILVFLISLATMIFAPEFSIRTIFPGFIILIISVISIILDLINKIKYKNLIIILVSFLCIYNIVQILRPVIPLNIKLYNYNENIKKQVMDEKKLGKEDIVIYKYNIVESRYISNIDLSCNPYKTANIQFSKYYGLKSVSTTNNYIIIYLEIDEYLSQCVMSFENYSGIVKSNSEKFVKNYKFENNIMGFNIPNENYCRLIFNYENNSNVLKIKKIEVRNGNNVKIIEKNELIKTVKVDDGAIIKQNNETLEIHYKNNKLKFYIN